MLLHCIAPSYIAFECSKLKNKREWFSLSFLHKMHVLVTLYSNFTQFFTIWHSTVNSLFNLVKELLNWLMIMLKSFSIPFLPNHIIGYTPNNSTHVMTIVIHVALTFNIFHNSLSIDSIMFMLLHCIAPSYITFEYSKLKNKGEWFSYSILHKIHVWSHCIPTLLNLSLFDNLPCIVNQVTNKHFRRNIIITCHFSPTNSEKITS